MWKRAVRVELTAGAACKRVNITSTLYESNISRKSTAIGVTLFWKMVETWEGGYTDVLLVMSQKGEGLARVY